MVRKRTRGLPKELSRVNLNAAGIDVGASSHFVAVSEANAEECVREFEAYTRYTLSPPFTDERDAYFRCVEETFAPAFDVLVTIMRQNSPH